MGMTDREKLVGLCEDIILSCKASLCTDCEHNNIDYPHCMGVHFADHLIANGVTVQQWIPVTERLPGTEGSYLVYTERGSVYASHFYTEKKFASGYVREASWSQRGKVKVTHWMPLPEPPKEGE